MKKRILFIVSIILVIIDIFLIVLFWKNYMYHISAVDMWTLGIFIGLVIVVESILFTIHIMKGQENLLPKVLISISLLFIMTTVGYKIYNNSVHYHIDYKNVFLIITADGELSEGEVEEFVEQFNNAKYIKRNLEYEVEGTPDRTTTIVLKEGVMITLDTFGEQIAVQVSGRSYEDSCYWMEQKDVYYTIE